MTPLDIITLAMRRARVLGVGQSVSDDDADTAFTAMNLMIAQWARQRYMVYRLVDLEKITTGAQSYTVGPGGDFDIIERPDQIESAFVRQSPAQPIVVSGTPVNVPIIASPMFWQAPAAGTLTITGGTVTTLQFSDASGDASWVSAVSPITVDVEDGVLITYSAAPTSIVFTPSATQTVQAPVPNDAVDWPLVIYTAREDYNNITVKGLQSFPSIVFYDPASPYGLVYPYPVPDGSGQYSLHITCKLPLQSFSSLAEVIQLPPVYHAALYLNLAVEVRALIGGLQVDPALNAAAKEAKEIIRGTAAQIRRAGIPRGLRRSAVYNVYADRTR